MACSLPVIATNTSGIGEILNRKFGKIIAPNMPEAKTEAVLEFAASDWASRRVELRVTVEERFSWDKNVNSLVEIYEELI